MRRFQSISALQAEGHWFEPSSSHIENQMVMEIKLHNHFSFAQYLPKTELHFRFVIRSILFLVG